MKSILVTLVVHDLHDNPIVRAAPLGWALERNGFTVNVVGHLPADSELYRPYVDAFEYRVSSDPRQLAGLINGDLIYCFKPLVTTLLPSMIASGLGISRPVLLDVEDDDLGILSEGRTARAFDTIRKCVAKPKRFAIPLTHALRRRCVATTVSTTRLQSFYGGHLILHGPDRKRFRPDRNGEARRVARRRFGLPFEAFLTLFAGVPREHKGFTEIVDAVKKTRGSLVLAGPSESKYFSLARGSLGERCFDLGFVKNEEMPDLLSAVDVVPIPLRDQPFAQAQLPAKLLEAMAMEKAVVVSDVGDLPRIIGSRDASQARGWVVRAEDPSALADCLEEIRRSPDIASERGRRAGDFVQAQASVEANRMKFQQIFQTTSELRRFLPASGGVRRKE